MKRITIAIDGHSSCGKSTLARQLAKALGYTYVDSGAMYRAVALFALRNGWVKDSGVDAKSLAQKLSDAKVTLVQNADGTQTTFLNGENVEHEIRTMAVSQAVSSVSAIREVRAYLRSLQQNIGRQGGVVMDGRDIGTAVFPQAELKIFMTATDEVRAQRRLAELQTKGEHATFDEVLANLKHRDHIDSTRTEDPLRKAPSALVLDNSHINPEQQLQLALGWAEKLM